MGESSSNDVSSNIYYLANILVATSCYQPKCVQYFSVDSVHEIGPILSPVLTERNYKKWNQDTQI